MPISRRFAVYVTTGTVCVAAVALTGIFVAMHVEKNARQYAIDALKRQFGADVALGSLQLSLFPSLHATGDNLVIRFGGHTDLPPMITVRRFSASGGLTGFLRYPVHIARVDLEGLQVHIPPVGNDHPEKRSSGGSVVINEVIADGATLEILPKDARKTPLSFNAKRLSVRSAGMGRTMMFHAELLNALPPGSILSDGQVGPWRADEPGETPVSAQYTFRNANLGVFKGIEGTLSSEGKYQGQLAKIEVQGAGDIPNFKLDFSGNPAHLRATFAATVDAVNGDTDLHPAEAFLGTSEWKVSGTIQRGAITQGREMDLNVKSVKGTLQDLLRVAVKGEPAPMTGTVAFDSRIRIPPGVSPVMRKLQLNGEFSARDVKFTDPEVQEKIAHLSHRAEADPRDRDPAVEAMMTGHFIVANGTVNLAQVVFSLPGAQVLLDGSYQLANGALNFRGTARLDATVSQMTTGIKRVLLKPVDPLFRHDGAGAVLPIVVSGARGDPSFRLDIGRAMRSDTVSK